MTEVNNEAGRLGFTEIVPRPGRVPDLILTYWHEQDSRRSNPGLPDWIGVGPTGLIVFLEFKSRTGKLRAEQVVVLRRLDVCKGVGVGVARPGDLPDVRSLLRGEISRLRPNEWRV